MVVCPKLSAYSKGVNAHTIRCGLSLFVIVGVVVIPWTQQESTTPSFCSMATKRKKYDKNQFPSIIIYV